MEFNKVDLGGFVKKELMIGGEDKEKMVEKSFGLDIVLLLV